MHDPARGLAALTANSSPVATSRLAFTANLPGRTYSGTRADKLWHSKYPEGIRCFRKQIFNGDQHELKSLSILVNDFYSLSECRDLCFHVQEHQFTTATVENFRSRKISVLWIHASAIDQDCLPEQLPRRPQRHITEQLGGVRTRESIHLSKHVSILGLQAALNLFRRK